MTLRAYGLLWPLLLGMVSAHAEAPTYSFGVLSQRSAVLTAQYWNPILNYISHRAGATLLLKAAHTAPESNAATARGDYDFVYSNTIFMPKIAQADYQVILRPRSETISGQIVTLQDSSIETLADLAGKSVGFPSKAAFVGYAVPMDHLLRQGVTVTPVFGGNQEGIMAQLRLGKVPAVGVNSQVMRYYAARNDLCYRVLWESEPYYNLPIAVHPRVPPTQVEAVRSAFAGMHADPEGAAVLATSAAVIKQDPPYGFDVASQADYQNYLEFYRATLVRDIE